MNKDDRWFPWSAGSISPDVSAILRDDVLAAHNAKRTENTGGRMGNV